MISLTRVQKCTQTPTDLEHSRLITNVSVRAEATPLVASICEAAIV